MEVDIQVANQENNGFDTVSVHVELDQTIADLKKELTQKDELNLNVESLMLYHVNSGLLFGDSVSFNQCIEKLKLDLSDDNKLSLHVAQLFMCEPPQQKEEPAREKEELVANLQSEIEQYRMQINNLETVIQQQQQQQTQQQPEQPQEKEAEAEDEDEEPEPVQPPQDETNEHIPPPPPEPTSTGLTSASSELSEAARLRQENEAHVQQRRQSRVMIVKSKISSEIQRGPRKVIEYVEDSPFFWLQVKESENRVRRLSLRLNQLCDMILDLCSVTITFSEHCGRIHNLVKKSWEDVEQQYASDILSLNAQFNELGEQFAHMANASKQLAVTMKAVLVDAFRDFSQHHLSKVSSSSKSVSILEKEYENALRKLLHSPKNLPAINPKRLKKEENDGNTKKKSFLNMSSYERITDLQQYEEWKKKVNDMRKKYQLKRYDHCNTLNAVINRHRYELILNLCACFSGFETFFHVGYEASLAHKVFHRSIQMGVAQKTGQEDKIDEKLEEQRKEIESILTDGKDYYREKKREKFEKRKLKRKQEKEQKEQKEQKEDDNADNDDDSDNEEDDPYNVDFYSGYLWKQSSNMKKDWKRRWFVLESGELGYYRSKDKLDREFVVNTMLCKVKERLDHDYRYVFELISPSRRVYILQAESEQDFIAWCSVLRNQVHRLLRKNTLNNFGMNDDDETNAANQDGGGNGDGSQMSTNVMRSKMMMEHRQQKRTLKRQLQDNNRQCADCNKKDPEWVSINMGVVICIDCCGVHRGLGTHISKVRSLVLDDIPLSTLKALSVLGNQAVNNILEHTIPSDYQKLTPSSGTLDKEKFIKGKYMFKLFINPTVSKELSHEQINENLYEAAVGNSPLQIFEALCYGANLDYQFESHANRTALHETSVANFVEATEMLLQNGASQNIEDDDGQTARELAEHKQCAEVIQILEYHEPSWDKPSSGKKTNPSSPRGNDTDFGSPNLGITQASSSSVPSVSISPKAD